MPWTKPVYQHRYTLVSEYLPEGNGFLKPQKPERCPSAESGANGRCHITLSHFRSRKCGPGFRLAVYRCKPHKNSFTVYPPGWAPFLRAPLFLGESATFRAVDEEIEDRRWPEQANPNRPTRRTQRRWIIAWSKLVGVDPSICERGRHQAAVTLGVATMKLERSMERIRAGPTAKGRARSIKTVISPSNHTDQSFLLRGSQIGFWGKHLRY